MTLWILANQIFDCNFDLWLKISTTYTNLKIIYSICSIFVEEISQKAHVCYSHCPTSVLVHFYYDIRDTSISLSWHWFVIFSLACSTHNFFFCENFDFFLWLVRCNQFMPSLHYCIKLPFYDLLIPFCKFVPLPPKIWMFSLC